MRKIWRGNIFFIAAAAAAAALGAWQFLGGNVYSVQNFAYYADRGELLFHAILDKSVSYSMPLLSLLVSWTEYHSYLSPTSLSRAAGLLVCLPAYAIGARGGRARGALFALAAMAGTLGVASHEAEQVFYSFVLLVFLAAELRRQESGGALPSAASGLAAAANLLIRSPLFAFPPLAAVWGWFTVGGKARRRLTGAALFLICAYLPLLPWARLNQAVYGKLILFEQERSTCNLITGASGIVFTIEGDARAFAGLGRTESAYPWAVRKIMENPLNYLRAVARRLWQVFRFFPVLFLLGAAGLWLARRNAAARFTALLAGYFILLHCLLSIEERYFYPVRHLLALLAAGGVWAALEKYGLAAAEKPARDRLVPALAALTALAVAVCLAVVLRFPGAARPGLIGVAAALEKYPDDPWLHKKLGETLLSYDLTGRGLAALGQACALGGRPDICWLTGATGGARPAPPPGVENRYELLLVKTFKELELGLGTEAAATFGEAQWLWLTERNRIKGVPYKSDEEHLRRIWQSNKTLWDTDLHGALLYWPPAERPGLVEKISRLTPLSPKLRCVQLANKARRSAAEEKELAALKGRLGPELQASEFDWRGNTLALAAELLRRGPAVPAGLEGELGLLAALPATPEETADLFSTHRNDNSGTELRAAAGTFLSAGDGRRRYAKQLAAADPDNFAYSLILLKEENFGPAAVKAARAALKAHPYALAAGAAAWAKKGGGEETRRLAGAAVKAGRLGEDGWSLLLLALQEAGDYLGGVAAADAALREHPGSSQLLNNRGVMNHLAGNSTVAIKDFKAAVSADMMNFSAQMNLGAALERAGERAAAAKAYSFAVIAAGGSEQDRQNAARAGARVSAGR
jgi:hypothetical protein